MTVIIDGTAGIANNATDLSYTGTLTGGTGVVNLGSGQVYKDASGNVGIGTSLPNAKLDVLTTASTRLLFNERGTGGNVIDSVNGANTAYSQFLLNGSSLILATGAVERARIDSSGNLLVGTTTTGIPTQGFGLAGTSSGYSVINIGHTTGTPAGYGYANFGYAGAYIGGVSQNGTTGVSYNTSSDYRLKNTIAPMTGALDKVALLKPCTYKWKVDGSDGQGFIAHELAEVEPGCVTGEKDAVDAEGKPQYQGIDTSFLVATLTAAIQEQQALIQSLTTRITALEAK